MLLIVDIYNRDDCFALDAVGNNFARFRIMHIVSCVPRGGSRQAGRHETFSSFGFKDKWYT